jgi:optic atrophy 3 protein
VEIGLRGGWAEFEETPLRIPRISLSRSPPAVDQDIPEDQRHSIAKPDDSDDSTDTKP